MIKQVISDISIISYTLVPDITRLIYGTGKYYLHKHETGTIHYSSHAPSHA